MLAEDFSLHVHEIAVRNVHTSETPDESCIIAVGHEADVLTVRLVGVDKSCLFRKLTNLSFIETAERKNRM